MRIKLLLTIGLLCLFCFSCNSSKKLERGNEIAARIEGFRNEKRRLPDSLDEVGIVENESGPIYYRKENESKYILWFGNELGESVIYDSDTKQWR